jgi:predicted RNA binding protein YcfA (HicA-like mRNA interferase family)
MPRLVPIDAEKMIKILVRLGFSVVRIRGSHHFLYNEMTKQTTVIPLHKGEQLSTGLLRKILRDVDLSVDLYDTYR